MNRLVVHQAPRSPKDPEDAERPRGKGLAAAQDILELARVTPKTIEILTGVFIFTWIARRFIRFARGGLALRITSPLWGRYWRAREYAADQYAASLGQADFLQINALIHDHPIPFLGLTDTAHPYTELRIDKLRNYGHEPVPQTAHPAVA